MVDGEEEPVYADVDPTTTPAYDQVCKMLEDKVVLKAGEKAAHFKSKIDT